MALRQGFFCWHAQHEHYVFNGKNRRSNTLNYLYKKIFKDLEKASKEVILVPL
ncbi:hypothetical protein HMPREF9148_01621 [Prevotella sp. F0091]|nr:hypothetical protein HMPREF9148_01621 [Prevotella sp. F0091]